MLPVVLPHDFMSTNKKKIVTGLVNYFHIHIIIIALILVVVVVVVVVVLLLLFLLLFVVMYCLLQYDLIYF